MAPWSHHRTSHWFGIHYHTAATSCYLRRKEAAVDAAIEELGVRA